MPAGYPLLLVTLLIVGIGFVPQHAPWILLGLIVVGFAFGSRAVKAMQRDREREEDEDTPPQDEGYLLAAGKLGYLLAVLVVSVCVHLFLNRGQEPMPPPPLFALAFWAFTGTFVLRLLFFAFFDE